MLRLANLEIPDIESEDTVDRAMQPWREVLYGFAESTPKVRTEQQGQQMGVFNGLIVQSRDFGKRNILSQTDSQ